MKVYYDNVLLKDVETIEEVEEIILDKLATIKHYYLRAWMPDLKTIIYDYGSHTKFFKVLWDE